MNKRLILKVLGSVILIEAGLMLLPMAVGLIYREAVWYHFLIGAALCGVLGFGLSRIPLKRKNMYAKDGFVAVALSWVGISLLGALPFTFSGEIPHYVDAVFEMVSGFTTTGSSILTNVEELSRCMLFWRSFSHWVGGMGILVFMLAVLPTMGGPAIHLLRAESPGPSVDKMVPKMRTSAEILYLIYLGMTGILVVLYLLGGMPLFDSLCIAFGTAGTGGFSITADGMLHYSNYLQTVTTVGMILFGVNFSVYYFLLKGKVKLALRNTELWVYLGVIFLSIAAICVNIRSMMPSWYESIHHAAFTVGSIITTTGYGTVNFDTWPEFSRVILCFLMLIGACAGSTGGGVKVSRIVILYQFAKNEISRMIHPNVVKVVKVDGKQVPHDTIHGVLVFTVGYIAVILLSVLLVSLDNLDASTTVTSVLATVNNIGPGLGVVGPYGSFASLSVLSKIVLTLDMLFGRLEIFPMFFLLMPSTWLEK